MKRKDLILLHEFNAWAMDRVLSAARRLTQEKFLAPGPGSHGGLRPTLVHILSAEWVWRTRCQQGESPDQLLDPEDFPTVDAVISFWIEEQGRMMGYLAELSEEELNTTISYRRTGGEAQSNTLWHLLSHVVMHGVEHRAEAGGMLTAFGHSPGDLDFIHFLRDREPEGND